MDSQIYIRPIALAESPQSEEGQAVRLAGGMVYASRFALIQRKGAAIVLRQRLAASEVENALNSLPDALAAQGQAQWAGLRASHEPMQCGNRTIRLDLGRWPVPMFEQYREPLLFRLHDKLRVLWARFSVFAAGPIWQLCAFVRPLRPVSRRTMAFQLALLLGGWLSIFLLCRYDPTPFTAWFMD